MKRFFAASLAALLLAGQITTGAFAADGGTVDSGSAYSVSTRILTYAAPLHGTLRVTNSAGTVLQSGVSVSAGEQIFVTAAPDDGYELASLTAGGSSVASGSVLTVPSGSGTFEIAASFSQAAHTVSYSAGSAYGSIEILYNGSALSSGDQVPDNAQVTVTAVPNEGYELESLTINGTGYTEDTVLYRVTGNISVYATYALESTADTSAYAAATYEVSIPYVSHADVTAYGYVGGVYTKLANGAATAVDADTSLTVTVDPDARYQIDSLTIGSQTFTYSSRQTEAVTKTVSVDSDTALSVSLSQVGYSAASGEVTEPLAVYDKDGDPLEDYDGNVFSIYDIAENGSIKLDTILPDQTIYILLGDVNDDLVTVLDGGSSAAASQLVDDDLFKMSVSKSGTGKNLISSVTQVEQKRLENTSARGSYIKIVLNDTDTTEELKAVADLTFKAKKTLSTSDGDEGDWEAGETATLSIVMWINNTEISGSDGDADAGDSVFYTPEAGEMNTFIWGDDRAALEFYADDDPESFYARLSTKVDVDIYTEYGDPVDAELYFYHFVGNPAVPSTSRGVLTLGIPWDDDDDAIDPENCYIYEVGSDDGLLTDVTSQFTYSEDAYAIDGWSIKTRVLGSYIVSDTALDIENVAYEVDYEEESTDLDASDGGTGTSSYEDMVKTVPVTGGGTRYTPVAVPAVVAAPVNASESAEDDETGREAVQASLLLEGGAGTMDTALEDAGREASASQRRLGLGLALVLAGLTTAVALGAGLLIYRRLHG